MGEETRDQFDPYLDGLAPPAPLPEPSTFWSRFPLDDVVVGVTTELIALPWCFYAQEAWVNGSQLTSLATYAWSVPVAIAGITFHWWKEIIGPATRTWITSDARRWWPLALVLAFIFVLAPDVLRRAMPNADEIATAVAQKIGGTLPSQATPTLNPDRSAADSATELTHGPYGKEDIHQLIQILEEIDDLLNRQALPLGQTVRDLVMNPNNIDASNAQQYVENNIIPSVTALKAISQSLNEISTKNSRYRDELTPSFTEEIGAIQSLIRQLDEASVVISDLQHDADHHGRIVQITMQHLQSGGAEYDRATSVTIQNIQTKIRRCRDYKVPL